MNGRDSLRMMVTAYPGGIEALAVRLGKPVSTLEKELRRAAGFKLDVDVAELITHYCCEAGVPCARAYATSIAARCNGEVTARRAGAMASGDVTRDTGAVLREVADVVAAVTRAGADRVYTGNELRRIEREAAEAVAAIQALVADVRAQHESGRPSALRAVRA